MEQVKKMLDFINKSPVSFFAVKNVKETLLKEGFIELIESATFKLNKGGKYFVERNNSSIIAFVIGKDIEEDVSFNIIASHSDSPCFKLKPTFDMKMGRYNKVMVEPYGGMICPSWLDRPLSVAGRVFIKKDERVLMEYLNIEDPILMIPNLCIHFQRDVNNGHNYDMAKDMQPFLNEKEEQTLMSIIEKQLNVKKEDIVNFDLYLYNAQKGIIWGDENQYISAPRLDDLECVYTSMDALISATNDKVINVLYVADNEEVGSSSRQGAAGDFLSKTLNKIKRALDMNDDIFENAIANSFLVSADNAHASHPNYPEYSDPLNSVYMNKGLVIKFNASQSYTSDGLSSSILQRILDNKSLPYQFFTNKTGIRGGSTLGNIAIRQLSLIAVDVGLAQLAMHSCYETAGVKDVTLAIQAFKAIYETKLSIQDNGFSLR